MNYCTILMMIVFMYSSIMSMDKRISHFLNEDVVLGIKQQLSLQEISRFSRTCKEYHAIFFPLEKILNTKNCQKHFSFVRNFPYDCRTRVITHYAQPKNILIFDYLWSLDRDIRDQDPLVIKKREELLFTSSSQEGKLSSKNKMKLYNTHYADTKKIEKTRLKQILLATKHQEIKSEDLQFIKKALFNSAFNIFNVGSDKKCRQIIQQVCFMEDADLCAVLVGQRVEPRAYKAIFCYSTLAFVFELKDRGIISESELYTRGIIKKNINFIQPFVDYSFYSSEPAQSSDSSASTRHYVSLVGGGSKSSSRGCRGHDTWEYGRESGFR